MYNRCKKQNTNVALGLMKQSLSPVFFARMYADKPAFGSLRVSYLLQAPKSV